MSKKKDPSQRLGHSTIKKQDEAGLELTPSDAKDSSGYCPDTNPDKITPHKKIRRARVKTVGKKDSHSLYKKQDKIYPKRVNGFFRSVKWVLLTAMLLVYYITPWIRWERGEGFPNQAILLDFMHNRFYFFAIEIWPQEIYYITGILVLSALGLFLVTSVGGRIWCGYACPQTIWTDLFVYVERFFEGDRNARMKLDKGKWTFNKFKRKLGKHLAWLFIGLITGGAWVLYFVDAPTLFKQITSLTAPFSTYIWIISLTISTYIMAGFAREQVCTYMCPWPRLQSVMMDDDTFNIMYKDDRGEPRAPHKKGESWDGRGDCIQCRQCVVVCPMGIDIRDGLQLECIGCALCSDACDDVMEQIGRPKGLISYDTLANFESRKLGKQGKTKIIRTRTVIYSLLICLISSGLIYSLLNRSELSFNVIRDRNPLFVTLSSGDIRNGYKIKILNKSSEDHQYVINISGIDDMDIKVIGLKTRTENNMPLVMIKREEVRTLKIYLSAPIKDIKEHSTDIKFTVKQLNGEATDTENSSFKAPSS